MWIRHGQYGHKQIRSDHLQDYGLFIHYHSVRSDSDQICKNTRFGLQYEQGLAVISNSPPHHAKQFAHSPPVLLHPLPFLDFRLCLVSDLIACCVLTPGFNSPWQKISSEMALIQSWLQMTMNIPAYEWMLESWILICYLYIYNNTDFSHRDSTL